MQDMQALYGAVGVRELDRRAIHEHGIAGYGLMQRAAAACWRALQARWPEARTVVVLCGVGNNGGDGYEIAYLARRHGLDVTVFETDARARRGDAAIAREAWIRARGAQAALLTWDAAAFDELEADVVVDAIFGTGLSRAPEGAAREAIMALMGRRAAGAGVLAVDIPSGLAADTGAALEPVVRADITVTFIGRKLGLYTGAGPECAGDVIFDDLAVPDGIFDGVEPLARLLNATALRAALPRRSRTAHKGSHGHVLIVGGDHGMAGAVLLAARSALRAGAGLVTVATRAAHAGWLTAAQPEAMFRGVERASDLCPLLERADVVAIGPGLGQGDWGRALWGGLRDRPRMVVDADALNLLAQDPMHGTDWILTPHPGEAARLLGCSTSEIQADRVAALRALARRYGGHPVLKGAGTLVWGDDAPCLCPYGNPGMGTGGMGDVLTGIIAALLAQGLSAADAAGIGVLAHARAGDVAAAAGERGLLPSDLVAALRTVVNPWM